MGNDTLIDVSCILVNYNSSAYTLDCVKSIIENTKNTISYEIIIVDNNSNIDDYLTLYSQIPLIKEEFSSIKLFRSSINTGFGGGNMDGVKLASKCNYYAFINNDTLLTSENCLLNLKQFMKQNPYVGMCGPQMLDSDYKPMISIGHFASPLTQIIKASLLEKLIPKSFPKRRAEYKTPTKVNYVQGAFMFTDAIAFNAIGGFDNNLFLYYEESDVSFRLLKQLKKSTYLVPQCNYIHFEGKSIERKKRNTIIKAEQKISLVYYIRKHFSFIEYKLLLFFLTIRYFFSALVKPANWKIFLLLLQGAPLSKSLKHKQKLITIY